MPALKAIFLSLALAIGPAAALAERTDWNTLPDPAAQEYEDPYRDLSSEQIYDLVTIVRLRDRLEEGVENDTARARVEERLLGIETDLADQGIDVDWLIGQRWVVAERREKAARAANPLLDGTTASLGGFLIPAPAAADGQAYAYLVPQLGQCSHTPPPPPNQLIRLRLNASFAAEGIYTPVLVTGTLRMEPSNVPIMVVDGTVPMDSSWTLETSQIEVFGRGGLVQN